MSEDQKDTAEGQESEAPAAEQPDAAAPETEDPAEPAAEKEEPVAEEPPPEPAEAAKPAPAELTPIKSRKPNPAGFLVSFILGVVVGVLAYSTVERTAPITETTPPGTTVDVQDQYAPPEVPGEALAGMLKSSADVADEALDTLADMNYGKASEKLEELSTLFERAKAGAVTQEQKDLMDDLLVGAGTVQEAVNDVAEDSVKKARALRKKLNAALEQME